jgi:hypothetical protein
MFTPTPGPISACPVREQLACEFRVLLDSYNETFLTRLNDVGLETATRQMFEQYQHCVEAREALRAHEQEHHCYELVSNAVSPRRQI